MKNFSYYLMVVFLTTFTLTLIIDNTANSGKRIRVDKLSGYIEIVSDYSIDRIYFPSLKSEKIFSKNADYLVGSFDISYDATERVLAVRGFGDKSERLVKYGKDKKIKTILSNNFVRRPSFSPNAKYIVYLYSPYDRDTEAWIDDWFLYLVETNGATNKQISKLSYYHTKPSWFPDGKRLVLSTKDLAIVIVDIATGIEHKIIDFGIAPTVSHDGEKIAYLSKEGDGSIKRKMVDYMNMSRNHYLEKVAMGGKDKHEVFETSQLFIRYSIFVYDINTRKSKKITDELFIEEPAIWSPNDKYLLYNDESRMGHKIYVLDVATGDKSKIKGIYGELMFWKQ